MSRGRLIWANGHTEEREGLGGKSVIVVGEVHANRRRFDCARREGDLLVYVEIAAQETCEHDWKRTGASIDTLPAQLAYACPKCGAVKYRFEDEATP